MGIGTGTSDIRNQLLARAFVIRCLAAALAGPAPTPLGRLVKAVTAAFSNVSTTDNSPVFSRLTTH